RPAACTGDRPGVWSAAAIVRSHVLGAGRGRLGAGQQRRQRCRPKPQPRRHLHRVRWSLGEWRAGLAGGYTNAAANVSARASSANIDTAYFAGYGGASFGALNFRSGAAVAWHTIGTSRSIIFPGFFEQASARYSAISGQVFGEVGYGMSFGGVAIEPFAGLAWVYLNTESFNETGGVGALGASSTQNDVNYSTLGARWASNYLIPNGMMLMPRASLAWQHAFGTV